MKYKECDIDLEYVKSLYDSQNGECAISKIKMTAFLGYRGRVDTNSSIDRIDNNKGYIKGNIQLVCFRINIMKNVLSLEDLIKYCKIIIKNNK